MRVAPLVTILLLLYFLLIDYYSCTCCYMYLYVLGMNTLSSNTINSMTWLVTFKYFRISLRLKKAKKGPTLPYNTPHSLLLLAASQSGTLLHCCLNSLLNFGQYPCQLVEKFDFVRHTRRSSTTPTEQTLTQPGLFCYNNTRVIIIIAEALRQKKTPRSNRREPPIAIFFVQMVLPRKSNHQHSS